MVVIVGNLRVKAIFLSFGEPEVIRQLAAPLLSFVRQVKIKIIDKPVVFRK